MATTTEQFLTDVNDPNSAANTVLTSGGVTQDIGRARQASDVISQNLVTPTLPTAAVQTAEQISVTPEEVTDSTSPQFQASTDTALAASQATSTGQQQQQDIVAQTISGAQAGSVQSTAAQGQATLSDQAQATAAVAQLPTEFLTSGQLEQLLQTDDPNEIPDFAKPAVAAVDRMLAARGIARSSIGAEQLTNTLIQSALPIAQQNAQALQSNFAQNLQNEQQTNLVNAQQQAQLEFTQLNNEQQTSVLNAQLRQQTMLSNQASTNASSQFNATSQAQTDQFMTGMKASIEKQNADRQTATSQFNAGQTNAVAQYSTQLTFQRDQFNAQNATAIEQSNVQWRRQTNQINTAATNAVNQANAMNAFNLSNQALTFMWQEMRDAAKWTFEATQNDEQRKAAVTQAALGNEAALDSTKLGYIKELGGFAMNLAFGG